MEKKKGGPGGEGEGAYSLTRRPPPATQEREKRGEKKEGEEERREKTTYSIFVFISRCSIKWMDSESEARSRLNSFSVFSICASREDLWVDVICFLL